MPRGAVLGVVDLPAFEQRAAPLGETALGGEVGEQPQSHGAEALAREVVAQAGRFGDQLHGARPVVREQLAQVDAAPALGMVAEVEPGLAFERRARIHLLSR